MGFLIVRLTCLLCGIVREIVRDVRALDLYYGKYLIVVLIVGDGQGFVFMRDVEL